MGDTNKSQSQNKTVLIEDERIISKDVEVAETMNEDFVITVRMLAPSCFKKLPLIPLTGRVET